MNILTSPDFCDQKKDDILDQKFLKVKTLEKLKKNLFLI